MSTVKSDNSDLTINASGSTSDIKFQANGVEKASISSTGAFTSTTIDATKLTGNLPAINGASLTGIGDALGDFAGLQGPVSKNSAYKNNWHSYVSSTSATFEAIGTGGSYTGIKILKAGVYECQYGQRGTVGLYGAISLDGDRAALEGAADKIWSHDHVPGVNAWAKGVCTGHFIVGDIISAGPSSTDLTYSTAGHSGWLIIKRLGDT